MLINSAKCLRCGDVLVSEHRHDFATCSCGNLSIDGGPEYLKRCCHDLNQFQELSRDPAEV